MENDENHVKFKIDFEKMKIKSEYLAKRYLDIGRKDRYKKVLDCANYVRFKLIGNENKIERKFAGVYFCKDKFCPCCMKRKSQLMLKQLTGYTKVLKKEGYNFLHLTLTLKNMDDPGKMLAKLWTSWRDLRRRVVFKVFEGAYVSLEVTYTKKKGYHFHFHVLLATKLELPMPIDEFRELETRISNEWLDITGDSYIVKLQGAKNIYQLCKYVTKLDCIEDMDKKTFEEFVKIMYGKRTNTKVGVFRELNDDVEKMMEEDKIEEKEEIICYEQWKWTGKSYEVSYCDEYGKELKKEEVKKLIEEWRKKNVDT